MAALLLAAGCAVPATRLDPADDATWTTLNERTSRHPTAIRLRDRGVRDVTELRFAPDTTRWRGPGGEIHALPTEEIAQISFRSRRLGAVTGARGGLLVGLPFTAVALALTTPSAEFEGVGDAPWTLALLAPVVLGGLGGAAGALRGADEAIVLGEPPPPDTRYPPGSGAPAPDYVKERRGD
jgi:hypothetical protein